MGAIGRARGLRLSSEAFDERVVQLAAYAAGLAIGPVGAAALLRNSGNRAEFLLGTGLALLTGLLVGTLGKVVPCCVAVGRRLSWRSRLVEFASYAVCMGLL